MTLSELKSLLAAHPQRAFRLLLPDGDPVPVSFHITEVGRVHKSFLDCGGTPREIIDRPASQHVADFIAGMNPVTLLTAADVMRPGLADTAMPVSGTAAPQTPLADIIDALARNPGVIGVIEKGAVIGAIDANDVVRSLSRYHRH